MPWRSTWGSNWARPEETAQLIGFGGFDISDPSALENPNRNDPGLDPELTDEFVLGVEHAFLPDLVASANVTWRNRSSGKAVTGKR